MITLKKLFLCSALLLSSAAAFAQTHYKIQASNGSVLDLNGYHAVPWGYYVGPYQHWLLEPTGTGTYVIRNAGDNTVLDVDGTQPVRYGYYGGPNQFWELEPVTGGGYIIRNANSGKVLDINDQLGTVVMWDYYSGPYQHWNLVAVDPAISRSDTGTNYESGSFIRMLGGYGYYDTLYYDTWRISAIVRQGVRGGAFDPESFYGDVYVETDSGGTIHMAFEGSWNEYGFPSISWIVPEADFYVDAMDFFFEYPFADFQVGLRDTLGQYYIDHVQ